MLEWFDLKWLKSRMAILKKEKEREYSLFEEKMRFSFKNSFTSFFETDGLRTI